MAKTRKGRRISKKTENAKVPVRPTIRNTEDPQDQAGRQHACPEGNELAEQEYSNHSAEIRAKFQYMIDNGGKITEDYEDEEVRPEGNTGKVGREGPQHYCNVTAG